MAEDMDRAAALLRDAYDAYNRGEIETALESLHPEVEWNAALEGVKYGRDAVRELLEPDIFDRARIELGEMIVDGDQLLASVVFTAHTRDTGIEISQHTHHLWTIEDGLGRRLRVFIDRDEGLEVLRAEGRGGG